MTRSRRGRPAASGPQARPTQARGRGRWVKGVALVGMALALAAVAWLATHPRGPRPAALAAPDPLANVAPHEAYQIGNRLIREGRSSEAIPYFRRAFVDLRQDFYGIHFGLAAALRNATLQDTVRRGLVQPVTRSSVERVAMLKEALVEFERASRLAETPSQMVEVTRAVSQILGNWGFAWDAFALYRQAQHADSTGELADRADMLQQILEHPERWQ